MTDRNVTDDISDLSELDKKLLGGTNKDTRPKKKSVKFDDSDDDDVLKDLMLDNSDSPKKTPIFATKKDRLNDIFGIKPEFSKDKKPTSEQMSTVVDSKSKIEASKNTLEIQTQQKPSFTNTDVQRENIRKSIFSDSKNTAKTSLTESIEIKKSTLKDDLWGPRSRPATTEKNISQILIDPNSALNISSSKGMQSDYSPTIVKREPRRGRRRSSSTNLNDPLGLFSGTAQATNEIEKESEGTKKDIFNFSTEPQQKIEVQNLPEWLGGSGQTKQEKGDREKLSSAPAAVFAGNIEKPDNAQYSLPNVGNVFVNSDAAFKLPDQSNAQFNHQSVLLSLQSDLKTAASLFQQYEQLGNTLENQRMKLIEQEKHFEELVKRQIEGQVMLDAQMKMQQNRVDSCLQTLLAQSSSMPSLSLLPSKHFNRGNEMMDKESEAEILVKKLQIEKSYLERTLESIKEKHEKEIEIHTESYKKQIQYLEESLDKLENRLKRDAEMLEEHFEIKIQQMKDKMFHLERAHEEEKEQLKLEHKKVIQEMYERHSHNIELLRKEHAETIENIASTKKMEQNAIDLITSRGTDIGRILDNSESLISDLMKLQEKMQDHDNNLLIEKESTFKKQEKQLERLREQLQEERDTTENYRKKLTTVTEKLESEVNILTVGFQNKMTELCEMENALKTREKLLIKDRELLMEQSKWEYENIQASKEFWDKEQAKQAEMLAKELENITIERGKLQVLNKLHVKSDVIDKAELESSIQAAKEATAYVVQERKMWQERISELDIQRDILLEKENQLVQQAKHLEDLTQSAITKRTEGIEALKKAHKIEQLYKEKFQQLQVQLEVLEERENKIALEKLALARDRINLRMNEIEMPEKDDKPVKLYSEEITNRSYIKEDCLKPSIQTHFKDIVDPQLLLLKLNLNNTVTNYQ